MPRNYGGLLYEAGARPGQIVGRGLMGLGQAVVGGLKEHERRKEKKEEKQLEKSLATINIVMKMAGQIQDPKTKQDYLTSYAMPMILNSGLMPEGMDKEQLKEGLAFISTRTTEQIKGYTEDNDLVLKLLKEGKNKKALKKLADMEKEYGNIPGMKGFLASMTKIAKDELTYGRKTKKEAQKLILEGKAAPAKPGEPGAVDFGGTGLMLRGTPETKEDKAKYPVKGFPGRTFTFKEMASEMKDIAQTLREGTKDPILPPMGIEILDEGQRRMVLEKIKGYAKNHKSKAVRNAAQKYINLAVARGWFSEEKKPRFDWRKYDYDRKETPKDFIDRHLGTPSGSSEGPFFRGKITR